MLLLFNFEKPYFDKENVSNEFVGHPLLENQPSSKIDINQIIEKNKALISVYVGSRKSEIEVLAPVVLDFVHLMNEKYKDITYVFHSTKDYAELILTYIKSKKLSNCEVVSDDQIKTHLLNKSVFAIAKSGTVSLEICNAKIPSIILYKMGLINFFIIKMLVKTKYANIINISAKEEIIPELLQSKCNAQNIFANVSDYLENPKKIEEQIFKTQSILNSFKMKETSSELVAKSLNNMLN